MQDRNLPSIEALENLLVTIAPEQRRALEDLALRIWNESPVKGLPAESTDLRAVKEEVQGNLLLLADGHIRFANKHLYLYLVARRLLVQLELHRKADAEISEALTRSFRQHEASEWQVIFEQKEEIVSFLLVLLVNNYGRTGLPLYLWGSNGNRSRFWGHYRQVARAIPQLRLTIEELQNLYSLGLRMLKGDMATADYFYSLEEFARCNPETGISLLASVEGSHNEEERLQIARPLVVGLFKAGGEHRAKAEDILARYEASTDAALRAIAARIRGNLAVSSEIDSEETLRRLKGSAQDPDILVVTSSLNEVWSILRCEPVTHVTAIPILREFLADPRPDVQYSIAMATFYAPDSVPTCLAFAREALIALTCVDEKHLGTIRWMRDALYPWIARDPAFPLDLLTRWVIAHPEGEELTHSTLFLTVIVTLAREHPDALFMKCIDWLIDGRGSLIRQAHRILWEHRELQPSPAVVQTRSEKDLRILINELGMGLLDSVQTYRFLMVICEHATMTPELEEHLIEILSHHGLNYPGGFQTILFPATQSKQPALKRIASKVAQHFQEHFVPGDKLAIPKELHPSPRRTREFYRLSNRKGTERMRRHMEVDPGRTPLFHLVKRISVGRGDASFSKIDGRFTAPTPFKEFSQEIEAPRLEIVDREGEVHRRILLRQENRRLREIRGATDEASPA